MSDWLFAVGAVSLATGLLFGLVCLALAKKKRLPKGAAFLLGFFLGPIGLALVFLHRPNAETSELLFDSQPDLSDDRYQLHLMRKYGINRSDALGKFVSGERLFESLDDALSHADVQERDALEQRRRHERESRAARRRDVRFAGVVAILGAVALAGSMAFSFVQAKRADRAQAVEREKAWNEREDAEARQHQQAVEFLTAANIEFPASVAADLTRRAALDTTSSCSEVQPEGVAGGRVYNYWVSSRPSDLHRNTSDLQLAARELARSLERSGYEFETEEDVGGVISRSLFARGNIRVLIATSRWRDGQHLNVCAGSFPQ